MQAAGGTVDDVVMIRMYTTDMRHQPAIWRARAEVFKRSMPCSTLLCVHSLFTPDLVIEVDAVGYIRST
jgi:enamine deaminase RidA (YjgF/YER057c/UK114 family)